VRLSAIFMAASRTLMRLDVLALRWRSAGPDALPFYVCSAPCAAAKIEGDVVTTAV